MVGCSSGASQHQSCMPMEKRYEKVSSHVCYLWYSVPDDTTVDSSQVGLWLIAVYDPTPPGLESVLAIPHWLFIPWLVCYAVLLSCHVAGYSWVDICHVVGCYFWWLLAAWWLDCSMLVVIVTCEYVIVLTLAYHARLWRGFIFVSASSATLCWFWSIDDKVG